MIGRQLDVLRRAPGFRRLFLATLGSGLGTGMAVIALTVDVFDRTGSGTWVAALLVADFLPMLVIGLLLGPLVDRFSRRRVLVVSDLIRFAVFCVLPFAGSPAAIVGLAAVIGFATGFFRPSVYAGMPNLVAERDLSHANSLFQSIENVTFMVGPLIGGVLLAVSGTGLVYGLNAATFLLSAGLIVGISDASLQAGAAESKGHWHDLAAGFRLVLRSRPLTTVLVVWTIVMLANAQVNVSEVALAKVSFGAGNLGFGVLAACAGLGLMLGSVSAGSVLEQRPVSMVYGGSIGLMAFGFGAAALSPSIWIAAVSVVVSGFGNGVASVCNPLFVQRGAPDHLRGRAFTVVMSVNFAMLGVGMALAGPFTDWAGARWVWGAAALVYVGASVVALLMARGTAWATEEAQAPPVPAPVVEPRETVGFGATRYLGKSS
ncbi:MAG: MFS transporter [Actinobacteria bacterium]|nr:MFS transporter [Actinomycetota bacterium]